MNSFLCPTKSDEIKRGVSDDPGETAQAEACGSVVLALLMRFVLLSALTAVPVLGQPIFDSGSDGSDGALDLTGQSGVVIFDPVAMALDLDRDNVFHFTTITIPAGVTLRMRGLELQFAGVYWLAQGAVQVDGTLDLNGEDGHDDQQGNRRPSMPGAGGFPGGVSKTADSPSQPGLGPGGSPAGGSHATRQPLGCVFGVKPAYGNLFLVPLTGGSGGGGNNHQSSGSFGGGAGGGALLIASTESIRVDGAIRADGANSVLGRLLAQTDDDEEIVVELYLRTLARQPKESEIETCRKYIAEVGDRREAFEDLWWALINSTEFLYRE